MLKTTTPSIDGKRITQYHGVVTGEAILGANAIVGIDLDYENITSGNGGAMLMVTISGTAVTIH